MKDKEWLKGLINEEGIVMDMNLLGRHDEQYWKNENIKINKGRLFYLIDQLDEPEVLSQEFIDEHEQCITGLSTHKNGVTQYHYTPFVSVHDLQNLLVPKQDKPEIEENFYTFDNAKKWLQDNGFVVFEKDKLDEEVQRMVDETYEAMNEKPVIPQFVADCIEEERAKIIDWHTEIPERFFLILGHKLHYTTLASTNVSDWIFSGNEEKLYQALKYGYEVEKEKRYRVVFRSHKDDLILFKTGEHIFIGAESANGGNWKQHFTESEIKAIDERFWSFAEEVTE